MPASVVDADLRLRFDESKLKPQKKKRLPRVATALTPDHPLFHESRDAEDCGIDKGAGHKEWKKRRLGGIVAAVNSCRLYLDWMEQHGGESTTLVYVLLARVIAFIREHPPAKLPDAVWMDNACA